MSIMMSRSLVNQVNIDHKETPPEKLSLSAFFYFGEEFFKQEVKKIEWDQNHVVKLISVSIYNFDLISKFSELTLIELPQIDLKIKKICINSFIIVKSNNYEYELMIKMQQEK